MQNTSDTESKKLELSDDLIKAEENYQEINKELKAVEQKMMLARENKARSGATLEGLENRKKDLINTLKIDLNIDLKMGKKLRCLKQIFLVYQLILLKI